MQAWRLFLAALCLTCVTAFPAWPVTSSTAGAAPGCAAKPPTPKPGDAARFKVIASCQSLTGVVKSISRTSGGEYQVDILPDPAFRHLLAAANVSLRHGTLLIEFSSTSSSIKLFKVGAHVRVVGALVLNENHGWVELYPVTSVSVAPAAGSGKGSGSSGAGNAHTGGSGGTGTGTTGGAAPTPKPFGLYVSITPKVLHRGYQHVLAIVSTTPGAHCDATLTYDQASNPLGALMGMAGETADAAGRLSWSWGLDYNILGGGAFTVTCTIDNKTAKYVARFNIVR